MSASITCDTVDVGPDQPLGVVTIGGVVRWRPADAVFCSRDGKRWHRVHVVTRREARRNAIHFVPRVARYWRVRFYGRDK